MLQRYKELQRRRSTNNIKWSPAEFLTVFLRRGELPFAKQVVAVMWPHELRLVTRYEVAAAIEGGDAATVRWAFENAGDTTFYETVFHRTAMKTFPGHCDVLDLVKRYTPLSDDQAPQMWQEVWSQMTSVPPVQWLVANYGASCLPSGLFHRMVYAGRLPLVEYLLTLPEQSVDEDVYLFFYHCSRGTRCVDSHFDTAVVDDDENGKADAKNVLALLLAHRNESHGRKLEEEALGNGDFETLQLIHQTQGLVHLDNTYVDNLAAKGDFATLQFLLEKCSMTCTQAAMDRAATACHLPVVQYLHETQSQGCTTAAMDGAAGYGHLQVVQHLHTNRTEGCSTAAMDQAACNGHLEIVQFLHTHRHEGCTTRAMDDAAYNGHYEIVTFLHESRSEGCTTKTMDCLAARGHVSLVMRLHQERTEGCSSAAMVYASPFINSFAVANGRDTRKVLFFLLENRREMHGKQLEVDAGTHGDLELLQWIHRTRGLQFLNDHNVDEVAAKGYLAVLKMALTQGNAICTQAAMDGAAVNGHLEVVQFLHASRSEGCSSMTMHNAAKNGHWHVVAFLHENNYPCNPQLVLNFAARLGKLELVKRFTQGHEMDTKAMENAKNIAKLYHQDQVVAFLEERLQQNA